MIKKLFVIFLLTTIPIFPQTLVNHVVQAGNGNSGTSSSINDVGATLWAICMPTYQGLDGGSSNVSIVDKCGGVSTGSTWTPLTYYHTSSDVGIRLWYSSNSTGCTNHTFVFLMVNAGAAAPSIAEASFSGTPTSSVLDTAATSSGDIGNSASALSPIQPGAMTPSSTGTSRLLISCVGGDSSWSTASVNLGFSKTDFIDWVGGVNYAVSLAYLVEPSGGVSENPSWSTGNTPTSIATSMGSFKGTTTTVLNAIPVILQ